MAIDLKTPKDAIYKWIAAVTGISCVWAGDEVPRPSYPYIAIGRPTVREISKDIDPDADTLTVDVSSYYRFMLNIQALVRPSKPGTSIAHNSSAEAYLLNLQRSVNYEASTHAINLYNAGLGFNDFGMILILDDEVNNERVNMASIDITMNFVTSDTGVAIAFFDTINLSGAIKTGVDGDIPISLQVTAP